MWVECKVGDVELYRTLIGAEFDDQKTCKDWPQIILQRYTTLLNSQSHIINRTCKASAASGADDIDRIAVAATSLASPPSLEERTPAAKHQMGEGERAADANSE